MAIVASDFHGNISKVERFIDYKPKETHIFAGDVLDSFTESPSNQIACLQMLLDSKCKLIWGNHELHYTQEKPFGYCSGFQTYSAAIFQSILEPNKKRFTNAIAVDGYLITHAGLKESLVMHEDLKKQVSFLNKNPQGVYDIGRSRGGISAQGGIFWFDHIREAGLSTAFNQVFGHTASEFPVEYKGGSYHHICINSDDRSNRLWIFDTKLKELKELT